MTLSDLISVHCYVPDLYSPESSDEGSVTGGQPQEPVLKSHQLTPPILHNNVTCMKVTYKNNSPELSQHLEMVGVTHFIKDSNSH